MSLMMILSSCCLVPNHITCVLDGLSRSRPAFIQSLMSVMATERRATAAAASLTVIRVHMQPQLMLCDDGEQFSSVENVQQRTENASLWHAEQHKLDRGQFAVIIGDLLRAFRQEGGDPLEDNVCETSSNLKALQ